MQKKLYMKDSRNLVNVQNPHDVCGNINDNFFIHCVFLWRWSNEGLVSFTRVYNLAIKLIT